jgi:hypothetical protein
MIFAERDSSKNSESSKLEGMGPPLSRERSSDSFDMVAVVAGYSWFGAG